MIKKGYNKLSNTSIHEREKKVNQNYLRDDVNAYLVLQRNVQYLSVGNVWRIEQF